MLGVRRAAGLVGVRNDLDFSGKVMWGTPHPLPPPAILSPPAPLS